MAACIGVASFAAALVSESAVVSQRHCGESLTDAESRRTLSQRVVCEPHLIESQQRQCHQSREWRGVARCVQHCGPTAGRAERMRAEAQRIDPNRIGARLRALAAGRILRGSAGCTESHTVNSNGKAGSARGTAALWAAAAAAAAVAHSSANERRAVDTIRNACACLHTHTRTHTHRCERAHAWAASTIQKALRDGRIE